MALAIFALLFLIGLVRLILILWILFGIVLVLLRHRVFGLVRWVVAIGLFLLWFLCTGIVVVLRLFELLLLLLFLLVELLLGFLFRDSFDDGDFAWLGLSEVVRRQAIVLRFDPEFDFVSGFQAERLEREVVLQAHFLLSPVEEGFIGDVILRASDLQRDGAEFEIRIARGDSERDDAVGWHFEVCGWIEQRDLRRLIETNVDRVDRRFRIGVSFVVPDFDAIELRELVVCLTRLGAPIDRELFALFDFDRRARIGTDELFGVGELDLGTLDRDVGRAGDFDRRPFPNVDGSARLRARIEFHVFGILIPQLGDDRGRRRDDLNAVLGRTRISRDDVVRKTLQQTLAVTAECFREVVRIGGRVDFKRFIDKAAVGRRVVQRHFTGHLVAAQMHFDRQRTTRSELRVSRFDFENFRLRAGRDV